MYSFKSQVRYSECGQDGRLSIPALVNYFQDCAVAHSLSVKRGPEIWHKEKRGWVILSWQIIVEEYPALNEEITVSTIPYSFHGAEGDRNFTIKNKDGKVVSYANSIWAFFNYEKQRPVRIPQAEIDAYEMDEPYPMEKGPRHISLPTEGFSEKRKNKIRQTNIDTNGHVNNEEYILLALAHVKSKNAIRELRVQYIRQAKLGDVLTPVVKRTAEETYTWFLLEGHLCAIVHCLHPEKKDA